MELIGDDKHPENIVYYIFKPDYFKEGLDIIDVGCGCGRNLRLMPKGSVGMDLDMYPGFPAGYHLFRCDFNTERLDWKDDSFDVVFCSHVLEHLESPHQFLIQLNKMLKPGGTLILGIPNPDCIYCDFYSHLKPWNEHLYAWNLEQGKRFIENCGFVVDNVYTNFPFQSRALGELWNMLPLTKRYGGSLWYVCKKGEVKPELSNRWYVQKALNVLFRGSMSRSKNDNKR